MFAREIFTDFYAEAADLLRLHWGEIAPYQDLLTLNPNVKFYLDAAERGALHIITARADKKLVGYIVMIIAPHPHYQHVKVATDDIHFIHKDYRGGTIGIRLFREAERLMKVLGAKIMVLRTKAAHDHSVLFERMGYTPLDLVYSKRIGD